MECINPWENYVVYSSNIDFGCFNQRTKQTDDLLLKGFEKVLLENDVIIFNQQISDSIPNNSFFTEIENLITQHPDKIVIYDTRHYGEKLKKVYRKTNATEVTKLVGKNYSYKTIVKKDEFMRITVRELKKHQKL